MTARVCTRLRSSGSSAPWFLSSTMFSRLDSRATCLRLRIVERNAQVLLFVMSRKPNSTAMRRMRRTLSSMVAIETLPS